MDSVLSCRLLMMIFLMMKNLLLMMNRVSLWFWLVWEMSLIMSRTDAT